MNVINVRKGDLVAKRQDKIMEWYLIQIGSVTRHYNFAELTLGVNSIIGILEEGWFSCDYIAKEDTTLIVIPCKNADDLHALLKSQANFRPIFLKTALEQRHQALCLYSVLKQKATLLHATAQNSYNEYKAICQQMLVSERSFYRIARFEAISMQHKVENWEINNSNTLMQQFQREYLQLMVKNDDLCVGAIMECAAQMHRTAQGIEEIADYLMCNRDVLWNDTEDDLFHLYYYLAGQLANSSQDTSVCQNAMKNICLVMKKIGIYDSMQIDECAQACVNYQGSPTSHSLPDIVTMDCVSHIMSFADYDKESIRNFKQLLQSFKDLPDQFAQDKETRTIRKTIIKQFYEIYAAAFFKSMSPSERLTPVLQMFLNFGFMDVGLLGEEQTNALVRFTESLSLFNHTHIYTIYEWLRRIYEGAKEPSKNEFDLDYNGYLQEQLRQGDITERQFSNLKQDQDAKVRFEIFNLFQSAHKTISGRLSSFFPILCADDVMTSFEKMAVTTARLEQAINNIRSLDYSILYREVMFSDPEHGIMQEQLMKEVMPDIILMPGVGSRSAMWQETSSARTDSPARFIFPIFINSDLDEQMLVTMGRYRWEICRRVEGVYWNDFRVKSLTSEFYDYLQFYRKNRDLSPEAREKLKNAISHARNNFREVFVLDYVNWIKYESQGSFRLNKVSRDILLRYCPFCKEIRESLASNPLYQNAFNKLDGENKKKTSRLQALYNKYEAAGGKITPELVDNLRFYQM